VGSNFHNGRNYKINRVFHKKSLEIREVLFEVHIFIKYQQSIVKQL